MKILMVNKYLYPRAGAETYMITVAEALLEEGHEVAFFGMEHSGNTTLGPTATIPFLEFGRKAGAIGRVLSLGKAAVAAVGSSAPRRLDAFVAEWKPDLIHAHNIYNQLPPSLFANAHREVPVLMTLHDYKPVCPNYSVFVDGRPCTRCLDEESFRPCVEQRCCHGSLPISWMAARSSEHHRRRGTYQRDYHRYVSPSHFVRDRMIDGGFDPDGIEVINNFAAIPEQATAPGEGVFYGGRLCVEKGVDVLLEAISAMDDPPPLRIAGDGPLEGELRNIVTRLKMDGVEFLGRISPSQVLDELQRCAVAAVPSTWHENCSMAIMEALAQGRPVLASDRGGNPDLVRPGIDGEVFAGGDPDDCRARLSSLLDPSKLGQRGAAAREAATERFSPGVHLKQLHGAYQRTVDAYRSRHGG